MADNNLQGTQGHESEILNVAGAKAMMQKYKTNVSDTKANKSEMSVSNGTGANADKTTITLKSGTSATVLKSHQDISGKANASEMSITTGTGTATITLKTGTSATVLTSHQDISGKADKSATVSTVSYDTTNKKITKTINGTTTDVVTAEKIVLDGGAVRLLDIESLASDYTFKVGDALALNGAIYKCTAATANTPYTLLVQDGKILYVTINGQKCYVTLNKTLNSGWTKVADIDDKFFVEQRLLDVKKVLDATDTSLDTKINQSIGIAYGTCTTAGGTAAKTVTVPSFSLAVNRAVSILFTNGFTTTSPTLNVNGTGAKAIKYFGSAIAPGKVRNNTILTMEYDGTNWNVLSIETLFSKPSMAVDLGLPSGLLWCDRNVGAAVPEEDGLYFSWGNTVGHPDDNSYIFSSTNYNSSSGSAVTQDLSLAYDGARANLGSPWRMPTKDECTELLSNCTVEDFTVNGKDGYLLTSNINGNTIFFPMSGGLRGLTTNENVNIIGCFIWSSSYKDSTYAWEIYADGSIGATLTVKNWGERSVGFQIRPVM